MNRSQARKSALAAASLASLISCVGVSRETPLNGEPSRVSSAALVPSAAGGQPCDQIGAALGMDGITVDASAMVPAGAVVAGDTAVVNQAFCRVQATARPSKDSNIKFEVWLPAADQWNGRFLAAGGGGNSGSIMYGRLRDGLNLQYATLSTDNGHVSVGSVHDQAWAIGHPEKVTDFGYRAQAVTAVAGKAIARLYYGKAEHKSYWIGCSQGGGKGLMQAQRYPENFDGIVAGAPVFDWVGAMFAPGWVSVKGMRDSSLLVPKSKLPMVNKAVLAACDAQDGLKDNLLQEPTKCHFDPQTIACPAGTDGSSCLSPGEVASMKRFWSPIVGPEGRVVYPGFPYGGEATSAWLGQTTPTVSSWAGLWSGPVYENATFDIVASLDVDGLNDFDYAKRKLGQRYDAIDPDLGRFASRNGKIILWQGWQDELVSPLRTKAYVDSVNTLMGEQRTSTFMRTYFAPGVNHCRGGTGPIPDEYDLLKKVVNWVENGEAPGAVVGTHRNGDAVDRTMPICPYPQVAKYNGSGDVNQAGSFTCKMPS